MRHELLAPILPALLLGFATPAAAQDAGWEIEGEAGASLHFGNTSQTVVNTRASTVRADSVFELASEVEFGYGEAASDGGESEVIKRSWDAQASFDFRPYGRVSPFLFGEGQSSLERRIDFRYNAGVGGKLTFLRDDRTRVDLSLALLAEQTFVRDEDPDAEEPVLARWSSRLRARRTLSDDRVSLRTESFYRPVLGESGDYVIESKNSISYSLSEIVTLKLSFLDTYDSRATDRGADANNDGQLLFSVLGSF